MELGSYYATLAASDRLRILVEELRRLGSTREILRGMACVAEELEEAEGGFEGQEGETRMVDRREDPSGPRRT